jgi:hypothetical protein
MHESCDTKVPLWCLQPLIFHYPCYESHGVTGQWCWMGALIWLLVFSSYRQFKHV